MEKLTDQIKEKIDQGITAISTTISNESPELIRIKSQIKQSVRKKEELLLEFGQIAYKRFGSNMNEDKSLSQKYEEIKNLENYINSLELEAEKIKEIAAKQTSSKLPPLARCECGVDLEEGQRFCGNCGKNVEQIVAEAIRRKKAEEHITCLSCGTSIPPQAKFCPKCGTPQKKEEAVTNERILVDEEVLKGKESSLEKEEQREIEQEEK